MVVKKHDNGRWKGKRIGGAALLLALVADASADGTEVLGPPSVAIAPGSAIVAEGVGLASGQPATININVPTGATVQQVLLYWEGRGGFGDNTIVVNGNDIGGMLIGGPTATSSPSRSYRADITGLGLVRAGTNTLTVSGLDFGSGGRPDGAGVLVILDTGAATAAVISIKDGDDFAFIDLTGDQKTTKPVTFTFAPDNVARQADLVLFVGDAVASRPDIIEITINGVTQRLVDQLRSSDGPEWDALTLNVPIPAGAASATVQLLSQKDATSVLSSKPDSLAWVAAALSVNPKSQLPGRMTGGGSIFRSDLRITHGFELRCDANDLPNRLQVNFGGNSFHLLSLTNATCSNDPQLDEGQPVAGFDTYLGVGTGRYKANGTKGQGVDGYTATWLLTDDGEPGTRDKLEITIEDPSGRIVLDAAGFLTKGNHQAHGK
jgi:hypothetical protein